MNKISNSKSSSDVSIEQIAADLKKVMHEAQELIKDTSQQQFSEKAQAVSRSLNHGVEQLRGVYDENLLRAEDAVERGRACVQDSPFAAIGIALGAGALIGMLFTRKH